MGSKHASVAHLDRGTILFTQISRNVNIGHFCCNLVYSAEQLSRVNRAKFLKKRFSSCVVITQIRVKRADIFARPALLMCNTSAM